MKFFTSRSKSALKKSCSAISLAAGAFGPGTVLFSVCLWPDGQHPQKIPSQDSCRPRSS